MKEHEIFVLAAVVIFCIIFMIPMIGMERSKRRIDKEIKKLEDKLNKNNSE